MKELMIATKNKGKVNEFKALFEARGFIVRSLLDFPNIDDIEETGSTFTENATIKAETISQLLNLPVIADDSGLTVDYLNGNPGIYSARYAGEQKDDYANIEKVLSELKGVPKEKRTAHFHCALALAIPGEKTRIVEGQCEGIITETLIGDNGFGYDPIFYVVEKGKTMAELPKDVKNKLSHRAKALFKLDKLLNEIEESLK